MLFRSYIYMVRELQWGSKGTAKGFYCAYGGGTAMGLKRDCKGAPLWPWWWDCNGAQKGLQRGSTMVKVVGLQWGSKGTAKGLHCGYGGGTAMGLERDCKGTPYRGAPFVHHLHFWNNVNPIGVQGLKRGCTLKSTLSAPSCKEASRGLLVQGCNGTAKGTSMGLILGEGFYAGIAYHVL